MKKILYILPFLVIYWGCEDMNDLHKPFIEGGEILYSVKPDSTIAMAGNKRILVRAGFAAAPHVKKVLITWDDGESSQTWDVEGYNDSIMYDFWVENLEEGSYMFTLYTFDKEDNRSVKTDIFGAAYSDKYFSNLENRVFSSYPIPYLIEDSLYVLFEQAYEGTSFVEITAPAASGTGEVKGRAWGRDLLGVIVGADPAQEMTYQTGYLPEATAIDTFLTASETLPAPNLDISLFSKYGWSVDSVTAACCCKPEDLIDGNPYSEWVGYPGTFPFFFSLDMNRSIEDAVGVQLQNNPNGAGWGGYFHQFRVSVSNDGLTWEEYGPFNLEEIGDPQNFDVNFAGPFRYVTLYFDSSAAGWGGALGEFSIIHKKY